MAHRRWLVFVLLCLCACMAFAGTVNGTLLSPSGLPVRNAVLTFRLQQAGLAIGSGAVVPVTAACYTSIDGSVVGLPDPPALPVVAANYGTGTVAAGNYYVALAFYNAAGQSTLASAEVEVAMSGAGSLTVAAPASFPANAAGMTVFIGTAAGTEIAQGTLAAGGVFTLTAPPATAGTGLPTANQSSCSVAFNDTVIPYTGYDVSLVSAAGNAYPGWPQAWQLNGGPNGTVNVSNGAPLWNGVVIYPMPILSQPLNHGPQSIAGNLDLGGYNVVNVGALGVGTRTPSWPVDVENGYINTNLGYLVGGGGGSAGQCLVSNGTFFGPGSCGTLPSLYYQHLQQAGSLLAQEPFANFSNNFSVSDNAGSTRTEIDLATTAVTAGAYTNPSLTIDSYGRVQAAANGPTLPVQQTVVVTAGICATGNGAYDRCSTTVHWPNATLFPDGNYGVECSAVGVPASPGVLTALYLSNKTATTFQVTLQNGTNAGAQGTTLAEIDCHGSY